MFVCSLTSVGFPAQVPAAKISQLAHTMYKSCSIYWKMKNKFTDTK